MAVSSVLTEVLELNEREMNERITEENLPSEELYNLFSLSSYIRELA
jgi:hypothetical protein